MLDSTNLSTNHSEFYFLIPAFCFAICDFMGASRFTIELMFKEVRRAVHQPYGSRKAIKMAK
jgi:hypothetical protein